MQCKVCKTVYSDISAFYVRKDGFIRRICKSCERARRHKLQGARSVDPTLSEPRPIQRILRESKESQQILRMKSEHKILVDQVRDLQGSVDVLSSLSGRPIDPIRPSPKIKGMLREAVACSLWSDWHFEEIVEAEKVNGLNEYNLKVSKKRIDRIVDGYLWLLRLCRGQFKVNTGMIWLGGDLFTGHIHEELVAVTEYSPVQSVLALYDILTRVLRTIAEEGKLEKLLVPCSVGNHGRTTLKRQVALRHENSYEWLLYSMLARAFENTNIQVFAPKSAHTYVDIYNTKLRLTHGDQIRYDGGIGGLLIPATKKVYRWNTGKYSDVTCMGHHHQYRASHDLIVNGSLIGVTPYSIEIGASYEPPQQAFFLIDSQRGLCMNTPIWAETIEEFKTRIE